MNLVGKKFNPIHLAKGATVTVPMSNDGGLDQQGGVMTSD